jgi:hypothetical protein
MDMPRKIEPSSRTRTAGCLTTFSDAGGDATGAALLTVVTASMVDKGPDPI